MCARHGIECYLTPKCGKKLCLAANEWANQDYVSQGEFPLTHEKLEAISARHIVSRPDGVRFAQGGTYNLDILTPKQREAVHLIFCDPSGERLSYGDLAKRLGVHKNAAHRRIVGAIAKLRKHSIGRIPMSKGGLSQPSLTRMG